MGEQHHLTNAEYFRMYGTLTAARIEQVLAESDRLATVTGIAAHIQEGMAQFPAEDFAHDVVTRLTDLSSRVRGANKDALLGIIESLSDLLQCQFNASDYGRHELRAALDVVGG